jgi:hypothetical protein
MAASIVAPQVSADAAVDQTSAPSARALADSLAQQIDAIFQKFDTVLLSLESELTAIDPQLSAFSLSLNGNLKGLETDLPSTL